MPLIRCPDCGSDHSTLAAACPKCGRPNAATNISRGTRTIEATGKGWKSLQFVGVLVTVVGGSWWAVSCQSIEKPTAEGFAESRAMLAPCLTLAGGVALYLFARLGAWWDHG